MAREVRDASTGTRVTYSPKVFVPLTRLCRDRCGYCTFATAPHHIASPFLSPDEVLAVASAGAEAGCHEALFTLGEAPEDRYVEAADWLAAHGYASTVDYLVAVAGRVLEETGLLPHANAGAVSREDLARLRTVAPSQGMMIESLRGDLAAHRGAPDKTPERRLATLEWAGELGIPFTTGILVGIGESEADRLAALEAIAASHRRHGHVQEVIVQNFLPKPGTTMRDHPRLPARGPCAGDRVGPAGAAGRGARPGPTEPLRPRPARRPAGRGDRRLGRGLPGHPGPREPRTPLARRRHAARRDRGPRPGAGAPADGLPRVRRAAGPLVGPGDPVPGAGPLRCGVVGSRRPRCDLARTAPGRRERRHRCRGRPDRPPLHRLVLRRRHPPTHAAEHRFVCDRQPGNPHGSADESGRRRRRRGARRVSGPGRRSARPRSSPCSGPGARRSPRSRRWPTTCAGRRSGTPSPTW